LLKSLHPSHPASPSLSTVLPCSSRSSSSYHRRLSNLHHPEPSPVAPPSEINVFWDRQLQSRLDPAARCPRAPVRRAHTSIPTTPSRHSGSMPLWRALVSPACPHMWYYFLLFDDIYGISLFHGLFSIPVQPNNGSEQSSK
jgi:hypothetical protein